jgi:hypothetical protein
MSMQFARPSRETVEQLFKKPLLDQDKAMFDSLGLRAMPSAVKSTGSGGNEIEKPAAARA